MRFSAGARTRATSIDCPRYCRPEQLGASGLNSCPAHSCFAPWRRPQGDRDPPAGGDAMGCDQGVGQSGVFQGGRRFPDPGEAPSRSRFPAASERTDGLVARSRLGRPALVRASAHARLPLECSRLPHAARHARSSSGALVRTAVADALAPPRKRERSDRLHGELLSSSSRHPALADATHAESSDRRKCSTSACTTVVPITTHLQQAWSTGRRFRRPRGHLYERTRAPQETIVKPSGREKTSGPCPSRAVRLTR